MLCSPEWLALLTSSATRHARDPKVLEYVGGTAANLLASADDDDLEGCHEELQTLVGLQARFWARCRIRAVFRTGRLLIAWHDRAKERVYAPGGAGAVEAMEDFCALAAAQASPCEECDCE